MKILIGGLVADGYMKILIGGLVADGYINGTLRSSKSCAFILLLQK
jgi:hypothetical protein